VSAQNSTTSKIYGTTNILKNRNKKMKIINLTPHPLTLVGAAGTLEVPASGKLARLAVTRTALAPVIVDGVSLPVTRSVLGEVTGLPPAEEGVIFVVSALVAEASADRGDVFSPGELLRSPEGVVIGAKGLCSYQKEAE